MGECLFDYGLRGLDWGYQVCTESVYSNLKILLESKIMFYPISDSQKE